MSKQKLRYIVFFAGVIAVLAVSNWFNFRVDLTADGRYTLSDTSKNIILKAQDQVVVDVFLSGELPDAFNKLQIETRQLLEEYAAENPNIKFAFIII